MNDGAVELSDLVGERVLDAVDLASAEIKPWPDSSYGESCETISFRLNGVVYTATENPDDGYRSSMRDILADHRAMKNVFPPIRVIGRHRTKGDYGDTDDVLELIDCATGRVVLEVGTGNTDDYYPYWVARFNPEAMVTNVDDALKNYDPASSDEARNK